MAEGRRKKLGEPMGPAPKIEEPLEVKPSQDVNIALGGVVSQKQHTAALAERFNPPSR